MNNKQILEDLNVRLIKLNNLNLDVNYNNFKLNKNLKYIEKDLILFNIDSLKYEYFINIKHNKTFKNDVFNHNNYINKDNLLIQFKNYFLVYSKYYHLERYQKINILNNINNFYINDDEKDFFIKNVNHLLEDNLLDLYSLYLNNKSFKLNNKETFDKRMQTIFNKLKFHFEYFDYIHKETITTNDMIYLYSTPTENFF